MAVPGCGVRLFADDCVLYRPVSSQADCEALQTDISLVLRHGRESVFQSIFFQGKQLK